MDEDITAGSNATPAIKRWALHHHWIKWHTGEDELFFITARSHTTSTVMTTSSSRDQTTHRCWRFLSSPPDLTQTDGDVYFITARSYAKPAVIETTLPPDQMTHRQWWALLHYLQIACRIGGSDHFITAGSNNTPMVMISSSPLDRMPNRQWCPLHHRRIIYQTTVIETTLATDHTPSHWW